MKQRSKGSEITYNQNLENIMKKRWD